MCILIIIIIIGRAKTSTIEIEIARVRGYYIYIFMKVYLVRKILSASHMLKYFLRLCYLRLIKKMLLNVVLHTKFYLSESDVAFCNANLSWTIP